ncbi:kinase-like protein [Wilcoxina mikolae CBS 423.85]|nr:kinase-like protein [Wilcoxina mikolae CBS 423.85]
MVSGYKTVAVKRINKPTRGLGIKEVGSFVREVQNFAWMSKFPEFVDFGGWHEDDDYLYIVMEHVPGGSLNGFPAPSSFNLVTAREIAIQLCKGLKAMHSHGIAHRDLNPNVVKFVQNILVSSWIPLQIKIADFGVSKLVLSDSCTDFRTNVGTNWYKAPEIYIGSQGTYTTHVDLWSLGCVLYWIRVGKTPFTTIPELSQYYYNGVTPSWSFPDTGTPLAVIVPELLRAKPEDRITAEGALNVLLDPAQHKDCSLM